VMSLTKLPLARLSAGARELLSRGILVVVLVSACAGAEPRIQIPPYNQFTADDETKIGAALVRDFESDKEFVSNSLLDRYMDDVVKRVGKTSRRPDLVYTCRIINAEEINAYSLPGGAIYVTTGLLGFVQDESELASVLAHETGHIAGRHILNRMSLEMRSKALWDQARRILPLLDEQQLQQGFQKIGIPIVALAAQQYDRSNENEADLLGVYNMVRAGWNPLGAVRALDRLQTLGGSQNLAAAMLSVHPNPADRSRALSAEIKTIALTSSLDENSLSFRAMKAGLGFLPKPGRGPR
jgi:predicted Zn-dependent protease